MSISLKVAFLDRDGVINKKQAKGDYVTSVKRFELNEDIFNVLKRLTEDGFKLIVITNQRGISRGLMTENDLGAIHELMELELQKRGIEILDIFFCPHGHNECLCRKPKPGMLQAAAEKYNINLAESVLISDSMHDVEMGKNFGIGKCIYVENDKPKQFFNYY